MYKSTKWQQYKYAVAALIAIIVFCGFILTLYFESQSISPSKYPIALSNILFLTDKQIDFVSIGVETGNVSEPVKNWITLNTTGLEPLGSPLAIAQGGKYTTSDYVTPTMYSIGQTVVIDRVSNTPQTEQLTITITSKMLQYTAGYYVNMQATRIGDAIAVPINSTWVASTGK